MAMSTSVILPERLGIGYQSYISYGGSNLLPKGPFQVTLLVFFAKNESLKASDPEGQRLFFLVPKVGPDGL